MAATSAGPRGRSTATTAARPGFHRRRAGWRCRRPSRQAGPGPARQGAVRTGDQGDGCGPLRRELADQGGQCPVGNRHLAPGAERELAPTLAVGLQGQVGDQRGRIGDRGGQQRLVAIEERPTVDSSKSSAGKAARGRRMPSVETSTSTGQVEARAALAPLVPLDREAGRAEVRQRVAGSEQHLGQRVPTRRRGAARERLITSLERSLLVGEAVEQAVLRALPRRLRTTGRRRGRPAPPRCSRRSRSDVLGLRAEPAGHRHRNPEVLLHR